MEELFRGVNEVSSLVVEEPFQGMVKLKDA